MKRGFTLIETIVYLALFGMIMTGILLSSYSLIESGQRNQTAIARQEEGTFLNRKLNWAVSGAVDAIVPLPGTLQLTRTDLLANESPLTISSSGNYLMFQRGTQAAVPLNSDEFPVSNVSFSVQPTANGVPKSVTATFSIDGQSFVFNAYLRK